MAFAYTFVQGVLAESPGGSWDVHVRNRGRAGGLDGRGSEAVRDREQVRRTSALAESLLRSCRVH